MVFDKVSNISVRTIFQMSIQCRYILARQSTYRKFSNKGAPLFSEGYPDSKFHVFGHISVKNGTIFILYKPPEANNALYLVISLIRALRLYWRIYGTWFRTLLCLVKHCRTWQRSGDLLGLIFFGLKGSY